VEIKWAERKEYPSVVLMVVQGMRVLRGVVYRMDSKGPRTEPWGTP